MNRRAFFLTLHIGRLVSVKIVNNFREIYISKGHIHLIHGFEFLEDFITSFTLYHQAPFRDLSCVKLSVLSSLPILPHFFFFLNVLLRKVSKSSLVHKLNIIDILNKEYEPAAVLVCFSGLGKNLYCYNLCRWTSAVNMEFEEP